MGSAPTLAFAWWMTDLAVTHGITKWPLAILGAVFLVGVGLLAVALIRKQPVVSSRPGAVTFSQDESGQYRITMLPGEETLGASVGPVGPTQRVFYAESLKPKPVDPDVTEPA
jgi:hypothetical protein